MLSDDLYSDENLSRNYKKVPLKRFEQIPKEDLEYLYITLNLSNAEICTFLGRNRKCIEEYCKLYGLQKSAEQRNLARQKTVQAKYGVLNVSQSDKIKDKKAQTSKEHYGTNNPMQSDDVKSKLAQTMLDRYGVDNYAKSAECQEKYRQTCLDRYGVKNSAQSIKVRQKLSEILTSSEKLQKIYETKKKNHSFNISTPENLIYERLSEKFGEVLRQYKSEKYPFACDFYIPEIDLYVEFQGNWTHGKEPHNPENQEHQKILKTWHEKARTSEFYQIAIKVWTEADPKKRQIVKDNNLNWLEFFTLEEFEEWFDAIR